MTDDYFYGHNLQYVPGMIAHSATNDFCKKGFNRNDNFFKVEGCGELNENDPRIKWVDIKTIEGCFNAPEEFVCDYGCKDENAKSGQFVCKHNNWTIPENPCASL